MSSFQAIKNLFWLFCGPVVHDYVLVNNWALLHLDDIIIFNGNGLRAYNSGSNMASDFKSDERVARG